MNNQETQHLPDDELNQVRKLAPLVSIDFIIQDPHGRVLLGLRNNEPAKDTWFVPGGRIRKSQNGEIQPVAFSRLLKEELEDPEKLGISTKLDDATFIGVFEHFYPPADKTSQDSSVHYIVLAYRVFAKTVEDISFLPTHRLTAESNKTSTEGTDAKSSNKNKPQHSKWQWFSIHDLNSSNDVHQYTKDFFARTHMMRDDQYKILADRRTSHNTLLWQAPALSLTAQAFLLTIALRPGIAPLGRFFAGFLAFSAALCAIQLVAKHRFYEKSFSILLEEYEQNKRIARIHERDPKVRFPSRTIWENLKNAIMQFVAYPSSVVWWSMLFVAFLLVDALVTIFAFHRVACMDGIAKSFEFLFKFEYIIK